MEYIKAAMLLYMVNHHYPPISQEAILAETWRESNWQHCIVSSHGDEGLAQWKGPRRANLHKLTGVKGCVPPDKQIWFLDYELGTCPEAKYFFAATTLAQARQLFRAGFEWGGWKCSVVGARGRG